MKTKNLLTLGMFCLLFGFWLYLCIDDWLANKPLADIFDEKGVFVETVYVQDSGWWGYWISRLVGGATFCSLIVGAMRMSGCFDAKKVSKPKIGGV